MLWFLLLLSLATLTAALMAVPILVAFQVEYHDHWLLTLAFSAGPLRLRQVRLLPKAPGSKRRKRSAVQPVSVLRRLARHGRLQRLHITASVFLSDAARTALLCGLINAARSMLPAGKCQDVRISITPDFWSGRQDLAAECIFSFRLGNLIADAAALALNTIRQSHKPHKEE